jgi:hypothetical protein
MKKNKTIIQFLFSLILFLVLAGGSQNANAATTDSLVQITRADFLALSEDDQGIALVSNWEITDLVNIPAYPESPDPEKTYVSASDYAIAEYAKKLQVLRNPDDFIVYGN